jgi:hypothetical protein
MGTESRHLRGRTVPVWSQGAGVCGWGGREERHNDNNRARLKSISNELCDETILCGGGYCRGLNDDDAQGVPESRGQTGVLLRGEEKKNQNRPILSSLLL